MHPKRNSARLCSAPPAEPTPGLAKWYDASHLYGDTLPHLSDARGEFEEFRDKLMNWYIKVLSNYANFSGRARRKEYWMFFLFNFVIALVIGFITGFIGGVLQQGTSISNVAAVIYNLAVLLPSLAVAVRRMHDSGRSGWWILLPIVNLVFLCLDSEPGDNKYGPNPKIDEAPKTMGAAG